MLGRTNTGGGGTGGILTVTAPAGVTVTVSKDGKHKTKTANANGVAVFKGLATGSWTLTITDGTKTSSKTVNITADYSTVIAFFAATISITYPAGSVCTCSDGTTTFTAPDTSGTWKCVVPNTGTWTVSCTNGTDTDTETVSITTDGQSVSATLAYWDGTIFDYGNEYTAITGGYSKNATTSLTKNSDGSYTIKGNSDSNPAWQYTANKIDLSNFNTLHFYGLIYDHGVHSATASVNNVAIAIWREIGSNVANNRVAAIGHTISGKIEEQTLDVSTLPDGEYYIGWNCLWSGGVNYVTVCKVWLT